MNILLTSCEFFSMYKYFSSFYKVLLKAQAFVVTILGLLITLVFRSLLQPYIMLDFGKKRRKESTNPDQICDPT